MHMQCICDAYAKQRRMQNADAIAGLNATEDAHAVAKLNASGMCK